MDAIAILGVKIRSDTYNKGALNQCCGTRQQQMENCLTLDHLTSSLFRLDSKAFN